MDDRECMVCGEHFSGSDSSICASCRRSYNRARLEDWTVLDALRWAAERVRRFERKRCRAATSAGQKGDDR